MRLAGYYAIRVVFWIAIFAILFPLISIYQKDKSDDDLITLRELADDLHLTNFKRQFAAFLTQAKQEADGVVAWLQHNQASVTSNRNVTDAALGDVFVNRTLARGIPGNAKDVEVTFYFGPTAFYNDTLHWRVRENLARDQWEVERSTTQTVTVGQAEVITTIVTTPNNGLSYTFGTPSAPTRRAKLTRSVVQGLANASSQGSTTAEVQTDYSNTNVWYSYAVTSAATINGVVVVATVRHTTDALAQSLLSQLTGSNSLVAALDANTQGVLFATSNLFVSQRAACSNARRGLVSISDCITKDLGSGNSNGLPALLRETDVQANLIESFGTRVTSHFDATAGGTEYHLEIVYPFDASNAPFPSAVNYGLVVALQLEIGSTTKAMIPMVIATAVLILVFIIVWGLIGKFYMLDDMNSLQNEMEDVMLLEFGGLEEGEMTLQKQLFTEMYELRDNFLSMADTMYQMTKYIPIEVVKDMMEVGGLNSRVMVPRSLTILFCEIVGFASMCERINSEDLVDITERYFQIATKTLTAHGCTIDKYIGDNIMGLWGAPLDYTRQGFSSIAAALHLIASARRLQHVFQAAGAEIKLHIGINKGNCAVGNIGSDQRISYTALGDSVNLAARLQGLNKYYNTSVIISEQVMSDLLPGYRAMFAYRKVGLVRVKGKEQPTELFNPVGIRSEQLARLKLKTKKSEKKKKQKKDRKKKAEKHSETASASYLAGTNTSLATSSSVEKVALLSEEDEISALRKTHGFDEHCHTALDKLSKGVAFFEDMKFEEAVAVMEDVLTNDLMLLNRMELHVPTLHRQKDFWSLLVQHTPPRDAFDPCDNMQTK